MATGGWCGLGPLRLFRKKAYGLETHSSLSFSNCPLGMWVCLKKTMRSSYVLSKTYTKKPKLSKDVRSKKSSKSKDNYVQMIELRKKILILRDIIDLPPIESYVSINELVVGMMEDLYKLYPEINSDVEYSEMKPTSIEQSLFDFYTLLQSIGDSWMLNHEWRDKSKYNFSPCQENSSLNEIVESVLTVIDCIVSMANERFDKMDEYVNSKNSYSRASSFRKSTSSTESGSETNSSCCSSPETPTSVLADFRNRQRKSTEKENVTCSSPILWSLRVKSIEKLNPIDIKHLLLPRLSHIGVNACPSKSGVAIIEESTMDVDDKPTSEKTDAADGNEEMEVSVTKEEISLSKVDSQKEDRTEEIDVSDIKEEKLDLSREDSQKTDKNEEVEVSDIKEDELNMSREDTQKEDRIEEIEVSDIKEEKLDLSTDSQKIDKNEEIEIHDIQEEKLDLSKTDSQKTDRTEEIEISDIKEEKLDSQKANEIEEIEISDIKEEKLDLSMADSQKTDKIEEIEMSDNKEEKLDLSSADSQKETVERTDDIASHAAAVATVEEFHAPDLPNVASEPPPFVAVMQPATQPAFPPPPPPPPMMHQNTVQAQQLLPPPPPPPLSSQPTAGASMAPLPPPPPFKVIATVVHSMVNAGVPPPPPMSSLKGGAPPPPMPQGNGLAAPPPPPGGGAFQSLRSKKAATKLKRSNQLGTLYRNLKKKVEGSNQNLKGAQGRKGGGGNSAGGKQGMADALAEMTKRSAYFQQIEEDFRKHSDSITALKSSISTFKSTNMSELLAFHESVESVLEKLTDESQVLARFEGFPIKKLENLRTAVALYLKFDAMVVQLQNWKIVSPMKQLLDRIDSYFNKIKGEVDALDRTKDEEAKRFKSHGIEFDFSVLIRIKESMVDISSNCMELALKEKSELKAAAEKSQNEAKAESLNKECSKMLWKVFQFAYRVYTFAGGHDERADRLTRELALEIESESHQL